MFRCKSELDRLLSLKNYWNVRIGSDWSFLKCYKIIIKDLWNESSLVLDVKNTAVKTLLEFAAEYFAPKSHFAREAFLEYFKKEQQESCRVHLEKLLALKQPTIVSKDGDMFQSANFTVQELY